MSTDQSSLPTFGGRRAGKLAVFCALHAPLALLMREWPSIALLHALLTVVVGLWWIAKSRRIERAAYVCSYVVGAEVLWRMTEAPVFWEFGKYAGSAVLLFGLFRLRRRRLLAMPCLYFILLLPSLMFDVNALELDDARKQISFNLSGPFAVLICAIYFSHLRLTKQHVNDMLLVMLGPICGIATIALYSTLTSSEIVFNNASNFTTSGGFGPNQVSTMLGLGALVAYYYLLSSNARLIVRISLLILACLLATLSALTFSRTGLLVATGSAIAFSAFLFRERRARIKFLVVVALVLGIAYYVVVPKLNEFTGGAVETRFENESTTGRTGLVMVDLKVWWDNFFFGVGPGMARPYYIEVLRSDTIPSHTEFSRLLSEHGTLGLFALLFFVLMAINNFMRPDDNQCKALVAGLLVWTFLYMAGSAMRLMAPAFVYGITFATLLPEIFYDYRHMYQAYTNAKTPLQPYWRLRARSN